MSVADFGTPRRLVAGMNADGKSYFARVEEVEEVDYAFGYPHLASRPDRKIEVYRVWASDELPVQLPHDGLTASLTSKPTAEETATALRRSSAHPGPAGVRVTMIKFLPDLDEEGQPKQGRLHWHDTFDIQWLVAGELAVSMDDGSEVNMKPGDALVQYGTNHAWRVLGSEGAVLYLFMLGAQRAGVSPPDNARMVSTPEALAARLA